MSGPPTSQRWITRTVAGIIAATFLSDVSHEMCTAVLPLYLASAGLGPAALGMIEGLADLTVSISKLVGGVVGHHVTRKRPWAALGYLVTALATAGLGLVRGLPSFVGLRSAAWMARGFRAPLRDYLLTDAVERTHYGRVFGLERAGDMLGAVTGPLIATALLWSGWEFRSIILWSLLPGILAAASMFFLAREKADVRISGRARVPDLRVDPMEGSPKSVARPRFPRAFWLFVVGVGLFGLGDFSRTFLIWLTAQALGETSGSPVGALSLATLLYLLHNLVSAVMAYPIGFYGDRKSKPRLLIAGYALGVITNLLLAFSRQSLAGLAAACVLSGIYIAVEENLEKAAAAEMLPRELRSLGFGVLATVNAIGDMASSLYVGWLLQAGRPALAFGIAAACGTTGVLWLVIVYFFAEAQRRRDS